MVFHRSRLIILIIIIKPNYYKIPLNSLLLPVLLLPVAMFQSHRRDDVFYLYKKKRKFQSGMSKKKMKDAVRQRRKEMVEQRWTEMKEQMNSLIKFGSEKAKAASLKGSLTQINDWVQTRYGNVLLYSENGWNAEHNAYVYETRHLRRVHFFVIKEMKGIISITLYPVVDNNCHLRFLVMQPNGTASITASVPPLSTGNNNSSCGHLLLSTYGGMVQQVRAVFRRFQANVRVTVNAEPYRETILRAVCRAFLEEYPDDNDDPPTPARM